MLNPQVWASLYRQINIASLNPAPILIGNILVKPLSKACNLGIIVNPLLLFELHVQSLSKAVQNSSPPVPISWGNSYMFLSLRLDYCNFILLNYLLKPSGFSKLFKMHTLEFWHSLGNSATSLQTWRNTGYLFPCALNIKYWSSLSKLPARCWALSIGYVYICRYSVLWNLFF